MFILIIVFFFFKGLYLLLLWVVNISRVLLTGHSLSFLNLEIIFIKSQLLQFSIHNFSLKIYHLKCLKSSLRTH